MVERVHHLNCGTLRPFGRRLINGDGLPFQTARLVCHCLLVETGDGLVLVDTGFGLADIEARQRPLGRSAGKIDRRRRRVQRFMTRPSLRPAETAVRHGGRLGRPVQRFSPRPGLRPDETAVRQVGRLGHSAADVGHVVLTHLDNDHAGGLADFPDAKVHLLRAEHEAAMSPGSLTERFRYWDEHWAHGPDWVTYGGGSGSWFGLDAVVGLEGLPDVPLVPLP